MNGCKAYLGSFCCILLASVWYKVLYAIDIRNKILQVREQTIDVEVANVKSLLDDLELLRNKWDQILSECQAVASNLNIDASFPSSRPTKRKRFFDEDETDTLEGVAASATPIENFKTEVFDVLMDTVISQIHERYTVVMELDRKFGVLWRYKSMTDENIVSAAQKLAQLYSTDTSYALTDELLNLKVVHSANFGDKPLLPLELLNKIKSLKLDALFPNVVVILRVFLTLPVTVAQAERSFSALALVKNVLRSTMCQDRLSSLGTLAMEPYLCRDINFDNIIDQFVNRKARKACF